MILRGIVGIFKFVISAIAKIIAWLLIALGLWLPAIYLVVFFLGCALSGTEFASIRTAFYLGLIVTTAFSVWYTLSPSKTKKKKKTKASAPTYMSKVREKQDRVELTNVPQNGSVFRPAPVQHQQQQLEQPSTPQKPDYNSLKQDYYSEMQQRYGDDFAMPAAPHNATPPRKGRDNNQAPQPQMYGNASWENYANQNGGYPNPPEYTAQGGGYVNSGGYNGQGGYINPNAYGTQGGYGNNTAGYSSQGGYNPNAYTNQGSAYENPNGYAQNTEFGNNHERYSTNSEYNFRNSGQQMQFSAYNTRRDRNSAPQEPNDNNSSNPYGFVPYNNSCNPNQTATPQQHVPTNTFAPYINSRDNVAQPQQAVAPKRRESPRIFLSRNDSTLAIYEYSDRLEFFRITARGHVYESTKYKA